ncbi:MAG TPA: hypothetical protein VF581_11480 [Flavobacterium sp.]|jgi:hypothetical protein
MIADETNPGEFRNIRGANDHSHINGWGIDADPENDPTYPMKKRTDEEHRGYTWERPEQQDVDVELLKSVERPNVTAVFGTSSPPSGISGMIRRNAFKYSESDLRRWVPLVMADRINVYEGIFADLAHGYIPNFFAERGWNAEWKYNRKSFVTKVAIGAAVTAGIVAIVLAQRAKKRNSAY